MNKVPNYPCRLFHRTKEECQLVKNEEDHMKLHQWKEWVLEDETSYSKKTANEKLGPPMEEPASVVKSEPLKEEEFSLLLEDAEDEKKEKKGRKGKAK